MDNRREFLGKLVGSFGAVAGLGKEARGQVRESNQEKQKKLEQAMSEAKKYEQVEGVGCKEYIATKKDSNEERELHYQLFGNRKALRKIMGQILEYAGASLDGVDFRDGAAVKEANKMAEQAHKFYEELNNGIQKRDDELRQVDRQVLGLPLPPQNPRPR